jgi:hypothetical protein
MAKTVSIGAQYFYSIREKDCFYIDKTGFIREWWGSEDEVTLITRPRRFGKTLNMNMLECFFSVKYAGRSDLFEGLDIWNYEEYRNIQGTYPVISLTFAGVKHQDFRAAKAVINGLIFELYIQYKWMLMKDIFTDEDRKLFRNVGEDMDDATASQALRRLCEWMHRYYGKKCIVILDEYDTPMQEAYVGGYWDEMTAFIRSLFNNTFKTNPSLERGIMTGITRVSKESVFSDLNNLNVVTTTSEEYSRSFGFTENEVFSAMDAQGIPAADKEKVKYWYDGFSFGSVTDIYNPWSVTMYLDKRKLAPYWANTSDNDLVSALLQSSDRKVKMDFERLLRGECIEAEIDEQIVFSQLSRKRDAIWSLLLATGYLKVVDVNTDWDLLEAKAPIYRLALTNFEVKRMFRDLILRWFDKGTDSFGDFVSAMFAGNVREMNYYMNEVALNTFSYFDTGHKPSGRKEPERFYHGFVLGLIVDKAGSYMVKSNWESGLGRYDVVMEPKDVGDIAVIMEFKVFDKEDSEETLEDTARNALRQIADRRYDTDLIQRGIPADRIYRYGFAFEGEKCLIRKG